MRYELAVVDLLNDFIAGLVIYTLSIRAQSSVPGLIELHNSTRYC